MDAVVSLNASLTAWQQASAAPQGAWPVTAKQYRLNGTLGLGRMLVSLMLSMLVEKRMS
jgi:hypothetical protein